MSTTDDIPPVWLAQVRAIALALPEATEVETWGQPTFRVRGRMFVIMGVRTPGDDGEPEAAAPVGTLTMKAAPGEQESLLSVGHPFFRPRYVGHKGWIGVLVDDRTDWAEVEELVIDSYRATAPKRLVRQLDEAG